MGTRWSRLAVLLTLFGGLLVAGTAEAQEELFVADVNTNAVTVYSRTAGGNTAPLRTLTGAATALSGPVRLAVDVTNNELFVANDGHTDNVYSLTASGNTAPLRTLTGAATGMSNPQALSKDHKTHQKSEGKLINEDEG
jgi:DNA-binding beta-propeller fold protein YncE